MSKRKMGSEEQSGQSVSNSTTTVDNSLVDTVAGGISLEKLKNSDEAERLKGKFVPNNTIKGNEYSTRALARFLINSEYKDIFFFVKSHLRSLYFENAKTTVDFEVQELKNLLFKRYEPNKQFSEEKLKEIRHHLIEFAAHYRSAKMNTEVAPNIMKYYIAGLKRAFSHWEYNLTLLSGSIFADKKEGLLYVLYNRS